MVPQIKACEKPPTVKNDEFVLFNGHSFTIWDVELGVLHLASARKTSIGRPYSGPLSGMD
jgi:hypothetical protein